MTRFILMALLGAALASTEFTSRCHAQAPVRLPNLGRSSSSSPGSVAPGSSGAYTASPNYSYLHDPQGTTWRVQQDGSVEAENGSLGNYGRLLVNGLSFSPATRQMTPGGGEYLHGGKCGLVEVTRTLKFDLNGATARFVDEFKNLGTTELKDVGIVVQTSFRNGNFNFVSELGNPNTGVLEPRAGGIVATANYPNSPIAAVFLSSPRSRARPVLGSLNQSQQATYKVTIPAGGSVALITGMRLHRRPPQANPYPTVISNPFGGGAPVGNQNNDPKTLAEAMAPLRDKAWVGDLPREVRRRLVNYLDPGAESASGGLPFKQLEELLERTGISTADGDVLLLDDETTITGTATCGTLKLKTTFGQTEISLDDVAAIIGGGGQERRAQVFLRTGEILSGELEAGPFTLTSAEGLNVELVPALMHLLALKAKKESVVDPPPAYLTTVSGDRLGVRIRSEDRLSAATPWGAFSVSLDNVESLAYRLEPQPMMQLALRNRTQLPVFLTGPALEWDTTRYGKLTLPNHAVRRWDRTTMAKPKTDAGGDAASEPEFDAATLPHVRMSDDAIVFGNVLETQLRIATQSGVKTVETRSVFRLERRDDGDFECDTVSSPIMFGRIEDPLLTVTVNGMRLRVPTRHIQTFRGMPADDNPFTK